MEDDCQPLLAGNKVYLKNISSCRKALRRYIAAEAKNVPIDDARIGEFTSPNYIPGDEGKPLETRLVNACLNIVESHKCLQYGIPPLCLPELRLVLSPAAFRKHLAPILSVVHLILKNAYDHVTREREQAEKRAEERSEKWRTGGKLPPSRLRQVTNIEESETVLCESDWDVYLEMDALRSDSSEG